MMPLLRALFFCCLLALCWCHPNDYDSDDDSNRFHDSDMIHDTEHIKEHLQGQVDWDKWKGKEMKQEEKEFLYFKAHDTDDNNKLDGLEMLHAMFHTFTHHKKGAAQNAMHLETQPSGVQEAWKKTFEKQLGRASGHVDTILTSDDLDQDGYITFSEYKNSRNAAAKVMKMTGAMKSGQTGNR